MRLKFVGHICPDCGAECRVDRFYTGQVPISTVKRRDASGWIGFHYWSCCYSCHLAYPILFDQDRRFIGIVPNGSESGTEITGTMYEAGRLFVDEIPF